MTTAIINPKTSTKTRTVKLVLAPTTDTAGIVRITVDGVGDLYWLSPLESQMGGQGWAMRKFRADETYHIHLAGIESTCNCKGGSYRGSCRHILALSALQSRKVV